jgi:CysZ protein
MPAILDAAPVSLVRRMAAGAWHVPAGFVFLVKRPRLWPLAALPAVLAAVLVSGGFGFGLYAAPSVETFLVPEPARLPAWFGALLAVSVWVATITAGLALGFASALLLAAPVLDKLSQETERAAKGDTHATSPGTVWEVKQALRSAVYFLAAAPGVFLLGLIPAVGPPLAALWAGRALSFQLTDPALARHGLDFKARRAWHRGFWAESLGFGLIALLILLLPCAGWLLAPALVIGATLLVLELSGTVPATSRRPEPPASSLPPA